MVIIVENLLALGEHKPEVERFHSSSELALILSLYNFSAYQELLTCLLCIAFTNDWASLDSDETQEHLQLCEETKFERRGLDLSDWRGLLDFWRRMKIKMAAVT